MNIEEATTIRREMRAYIRIFLGGVQQRLADKLDCHRENLSNFLTGKTGTMRKGVIERFREMYRQDMAVINGEGATVADQVEPYGNVLLRELQDAEIESIVGRLEHLVADLKRQGLSPRIKFSQLVRIFKGVSDEFFHIREESSKTPTR